MFLWEVIFFNVKHPSYITTKKLNIESAFSVLAGNPASICKIEYKGLVSKEE